MAGSRRLVAFWRDGVTAGYMRDASPLAPEANFVRDVDYCSGAFLMVRGDLLRTLDGLSNEFIPAYYEDVDLCVARAKPASASSTIPTSWCIITKYGSAKSFRAVEAETARAREVFIRRNQPYLRFRYIADPRAEVFARSIGEGRGRILFIEDQVPLRMLGSGFVRSNDLICAMASLGFHVTLFPMNDSGFDPAAVYADMPETVEVMHDRCFADLAEFLESRDGYYDTIWIVRAHNLDRARPVLERVVVGKGRPPRIVLDTEAIFAIRDAIHANIAGDPVAPDLDGAILHEFVNATFCQRIVAINEAEAAHLRRLISPDVSVIGHVRHVSLTPRPFESRAGLLFVGAFHTLDCPELRQLVLVRRRGAAVPGTGAELGDATDSRGLSRPGCRARSLPRPSEDQPAGRRIRDRTAVRFAPGVRRADPLRRRRAVQGVRGRLVRYPRRGHRAAPLTTRVAGPAGPPLRRGHQPRRFRQICPPPLPRSGAVAEHPRVRREPPLHREQPRVLYAQPHRRARRRRLALNARPPLAAPGFGAIAGFGVAAHDIRLGMSLGNRDDPDPDRQAERR